MPHNNIRGIYSPENTRQTAYKGYLSGVLFFSFPAWLCKRKGEQKMTLTDFLIFQKNFSKTFTNLWQFYLPDRNSNEREKHHPPLRTRKGVNM